MAVMPCFFLFSLSLFHHLFHHPTPPFPPFLFHLYCPLPVPPLFFFFPSLVYISQTCEFSCIHEFFSDFLFTGCWKVWEKVSKNQWVRGYQQPGEAVDWDGELLWSFLIPSRYWHDEGKSLLAVRYCLLEIRWWTVHSGLSPTPTLSLVLPFVIVIVPHLIQSVSSCYPSLMVVVSHHELCSQGSVSRPWSDFPGCTFVLPAGLTG